ncbi:hypothetical protein BDW02DRAFT_593291 [Decorospora gaudefroyi]|uniref:Uncharacterized protein n=1 Tax=Decorospora gaudefroyi TaxID=184978 RepID=A0A6A5K1Q2_9PLEO|nr:hypothetical protein BDW02DRAFT_593291 [Decorospora gaudefroyi]
MLSWFRAHAYTFKNNEEEKLDYICMKTGGVAWDNISSGWFIEGEEYQTAQQAWDILDTCYGRLNTRLNAHNFYEKEGTIKSGETISSYLARFKAVDYIIDDERLTTDFTAFSNKLRRLEQLHSTLYTGNPTTNTNSNKGAGGGGGGNRNCNQNTTTSSRGDGAPQFIVLADMQRCYKCTRKGHKPNADNAPCKDNDKITLMGRYPEVLAALNEARKVAGIPILKAAVRVNGVQGPIPPPSAASEAHAENE